MPNTAEQAIYDRLASAPSFHPANAELLLNDWALEPGDVVTVKSGDQNYSLPIYSLNLNWTGSNLSGPGNSNTTRIAIESTGHKEREPLPELRRKQFEQGRYAYTGFKAQQQEIDEHYQHVVNVTDKGMSDAFGIIGVSIDPETGMPKKDETTGEYIWVEDDPSVTATYGEIWGHLNRSAWATQILNQIKDANGNVLSLGEVYTDAYGNAIINAINDQRTGLAQIKADRIKIDSTSGSSFSIENDGTMTFNAENAIAAINAAIAEINAGKIKLTSSGSTTVTLDDKVSIDTDGYIVLNGTTIIKGPLSLTQNYGVSAREFVVGTGGRIRLIGANTGEYYDLSASNMPECIRGLQFVEDPSNSGHFILQKKTIYNGATWTDETNFNIAATRFYLDHVAAAYADAVNRVSWPTPPRSLSSFIVNVPTSPWNASAETGTTENRIFELGVGAFDSNYISVVDVTMKHNENGQAVTDGVVAEINVDAGSVYSAGWAAAYAMVDMPDLNTSTGSFDVKVPSSTQGQQDTHSFTVQKDTTPSASGNVSVYMNNLTVARVPIGDWYSAGDSAGYTRAANQRTTLTATSNGTYTPSFGYSSVTVNVPSSSIAVNDIQLYASGYQQGTQSKTGVTTSLGSNSDGSDPVQIFSNTVFQLDHWYCFKINVNGVSKGYYFKASS